MDGDITDTKRKRVSSSKDDFLDIDSAIKSCKKRTKRPKSEGSINANKPRPGRPSSQQSIQKVTLDVKKTPGTHHLRSTGNTMEEKFRKEAESSFLSRYRALKKSVGETNKELKSTSSTHTDLSAAVKAGVKEACTPLVDWNCVEAKRIGAKCKVYWDGNKEWFYARILNYDREYDKYYIFYDTDKTAEWIRLNDEAVLIATDIILAKTRGVAVWPALKYWMSEKAKGIFKDANNSGKNEFVEFFDEKGVAEYMFVSPKNILSFDEKNMPTKPTKNFQNFIETARKEKSTIDGVLDTVINAVRKLAIIMLHGNQWLGVRVRAEAHLISNNEDDSLVDTDDGIMCSGTVARYCAALGSHFILFDENLLLPKWVTLPDCKVEILLGSEEAGSEMSVAYAQSLKYHECNGCNMCGNMKNEASTYFECSNCNTWAHYRCMPCDGFAEIYSTVVPSRESKLLSQKCWNCRCCDCCGVKNWDAALLDWNLKYIDRLAPDQMLNICGECLTKFRQSRDFCPICFKLYMSEDAFFQQKELMSKSNSDSSSNNSTLSDANVNKEKSLLSLSSKDSNDDMVQCNHCNRWVHCQCEGIDKVQYEMMSNGNHPVWGDEYLCPVCRTQVSEDLVEKLKAFDHNSTFAEPVTEVVAKNYFDIIRSPMDLSTMAKKAMKGQYMSIQILRNDFELMCYNALLYNKVGDEYWNEAWNYFLAGRNTFEAFPRHSKAAYLTNEIEELHKKGLEKIKETQQAQRQIKLAESKRSKPDNFDSERPSNRRKRYSELNEEQESGNRQSTDTEVSSDVRGKADDFQAKSKENIVQDISSSELTKPSGGKVSIASVEDDDSSPYSTEVVLPSILSPCPNPYSFYDCCTTTVSADESIFACALDCCVLCGSCGFDSYFIFCVDCGEAFHSFCIDIPLSSMNTNARHHWRCTNCKVCEICRLSSDLDSNKLLYCERCDRTYHRLCLSPSLDEMPKCSWYCQECVACELAFNVKHSWGFENKKCYSCHQSEVKHIEMQRQRRIDESFLKYDHFVECGVCKTDCRSSFQKCNSCHSSFHTNCIHYENKISEILRRDRWECSTCLSRENIRTHLGSSQKAISILEKAAQIQRARMVHHQQSKQNLVLEMENLVFSSIEGNRYICLALLVWGIKRIHSLENVDQSIFRLENANDKLSLLSQQSLWLFYRASRFVGMWRSLGMIQSASRISRRRNLELGLGRDGRELSLGVLSRYACMAAAFLEYTKGECGDAKGPQELAAVAEFILYKMGSNRVAPFTDEERITKCKEIMKQVRHALTAFLVAPIGLKETSSSTELLLENNEYEVKNEVTLSSPKWCGSSTLTHRLFRSLPLKRNSQSPVACESLSNEEHVHIPVTSSQESCRDPPSTKVEEVEEEEEETNGDVSTRKNNFCTIFPRVSSLSPVILEKTDNYYGNKSKLHILNPLTDENSSKCSIESDICLDFSLSVKAAREELGPSRFRVVPPMGKKKMASVSVSPSAFGLTSNLAARDSVGTKVEALSHSPSICFDRNQHGQSFSQGMSPTSSSTSPPSPHGITSSPLIGSESLNETESMNPARAKIKLHGEDHGNKMKQNLFTPIKMEDAMKAGEDTNEVSAFLESLTAQTYQKLHSIPCIVNSKISNSWKEIGQFLPQTFRDVVDLTSVDDEEMKDRQIVDYVVETMSFLAREDSNSLSAPLNPLNEHKSCGDIYNLHGWSHQEMSDGLDWRDYRYCHFCMEPEGDSRLGRILSFGDGIMTHVNCIRYAPEVIEVKGVLTNASIARARSLKSRCYLCRNRGATACCLQKSCKRFFHLKCALAFHCVTCNAKDNSASFDHQFGIYSCMICPEHCSLLNGMTARSSWPTDPKRLILLDDFSTTVTPSLAMMLSQHRADRVVRTGALFIHSIGNIRPELPKFHNQDFIYPHRFRSSRIYWSAKSPLKRTVYFFEILMQSDLTSICDMTPEQLILSSKNRFKENSSYHSILEILLGAATSSPSYTRATSSDTSIDAENYVDGPIFRLISLEFLDIPLYSTSMEELYAMMLCQVQSAWDFTSRKSFDSYGVTPQQFFGLSLPIVRQAIELMPESVGAMISLSSSIPGYRPTYRIPSMADLKRLNRFNRMMSNLLENKSSNGCARLDSVNLHVVRFRPTPRKQFLTKAVEEESESTKEVDTKEEIEENDLEVGRLEIEKQYFKLADGYRRNPFARLEVKKSHIHGYGLFSRSHFDKNEMIVEYIGEKVRQAVADRRERQYELEGLGSCYLFRLDKDEIVDASRSGGMARFMNHCCEPNAYARIITAGLQDDNDSPSKHIVIFAARDIEEGEEITYDYKFPIEEGNKLKCFCGASKCQGSMN